MKKKIIIALTIVLCFSIMVIKKASAEEIETTSTSSEWKGTPVPNGYIEKVYFNLNLSISEVQNELNKLEYSINEVLSSAFYTEVYMYNVFDCENHIYQIGFLRAYGVNLICYDGPEGELIPIFSDGVLPGLVEFVGWKNDFIGYFSVNDRALSIYLDEEIGKQNYLISTLFSITPFELETNSNGGFTQEDIDKAYNDGMADGWQAGYDDGYEQGWNEGEREGYNDGCVDGYQDGYDEGIKKGEEVNANLGDMFLNILDSPRQAISNILNFEFLGINLASLVFFLITAILVVVIIKFFI